MLPLGFRDILGPGFRRDGPPVQCPHCNKVISKPTNILAGEALMGAAVGWVIYDACSYFGLSWIYIFIIDMLYFAALFIAIYLFFPLKMEE